MPKGAAACLGGAGHPPFHLPGRAISFLDSFATDRVSLFSFGEFLRYQLCHSHIVCIYIYLCIYIYISYVYIYIYYCYIFSFCWQIDTVMMSKFQPPCHVTPSMPSMPWPLHPPQWHLPGH